MGRRGHHSDSESVDSDDSRLRQRSRRDRDCSRSPSRDCDRNRDRDHERSRGHGDRDHRDHRDRDRRDRDRRDGDRYREQDLHRQPGYGYAQQGYPPQQQRYPPQQHRYPPQQQHGYPPQQQTGYARQQRPGDPPRSAPRADPRDAAQAGDSSKQRDAARRSGDACASGRSGGGWKANSQQLRARGLPEPDVDSFLIWAAERWGGGADVYTSADHLHASDVTSQLNAWRGARGMRAVDERRVDATLQLLHKECCMPNASFTLTKARARFALANPRSRRSRP